MRPTVLTGEGAAADFVESVRSDLAEVLGFRPFSGTLNVDRLPVREELPSTTVTSDPFVTDHCDGVTVRSCSIGGVRGAVFRPLVADYPDGKIELLAPVRLRSLFDLDDGSEVPVSSPGEVYHPDAVGARAGALDEFDAVVFDLDGTLVDLDVDWERVHTGIETLLEDVLDGPLTAYDRPEIMDLARDNGLYDDLDALLTDHEVEGAATATQLPLLDRLGEIDRPIGVCTANAAAAATRALERYGVRDHVDAVVARDTVREGKPHPRPLERCLGALDATAGNAIFVGDERTDAETAVAAGTSFLHPEQFA